MRMLRGVKEVKWGEKMFIVTRVETINTAHFNNVYCGKENKSGRHYVAITRIGVGGFGKKICLCRSQRLAEKVCQYIKEHWNTCIQISEYELLHRWD